MNEKKKGSLGYLNNVPEVTNSNPSHAQRDVGKMSEQIVNLKPQAF